MRDHNKAFCRLVAETFDCPGPVFEFGSYQVEGQEGYANLRELFPGKTYVGCDMRPGPGVDRVEDVTAISLPDSSAGTVLCIETFEHVVRSTPRVRRSFPPPQTRRCLYHHVAIELSNPCLPGRLLADDTQLPSTVVVTVRRADVGLSRIPLLPAHRHGHRCQRTHSGGLQSTA